MLTVLQILPAKRVPVLALALVYYVERTPSVKSKTTALGVDAGLASVKDGTVNVSHVSALNLRNP